MKFRLNSISDNLIWVCITVYFALIPLAVVITEDSGMGKYWLLMPLVVMLIVKISASGGKLSLNFTAYDTYILLFAVFSYLTALWAENANYAIAKATNTIEVLIAMYIIRLCIPEKNNIVNLLKTIMWGNFGLVYYAIFRYGWAYVMLAISSDIRMVSTIINANTVGMGAAFAILISVYLLLYEGFNIGLFFSIPAIIVLAASGSRKALLILVLGVIGLFILKNIDKKNVLLSFFRVLITLIVLIFLFYQVSKLAMFEGVNERVQGLVNGFLGTGIVDHSTSVRMRMIGIGMDLFKKNPLFGIGIDNAKIYTESVFGISNYYLHNNYVELLADGGIVGILIYYSIYIILLVRLWKNRNFNSGEFNVVFVIFLLRLILDYGMVSYESKSTYFYLLVFFLEAEKLRKARVDKEEVRLDTEIASKAIFQQKVRCKEDLI